MPTITSTEAGATGRYINLGSPASQDSFSAQTVIVYCKHASRAVTGYMFAKCSSTATGGPRFVVLADGTLSFGRDSSGAASAPEGFSAGGAVTTGAWGHYQATDTGALDGTGIKLYINAGADIVFGRNAGTGTIVDDAAQEVYLMNRPGLGREFVGDKGYVAHWNRVLSDAERTTVRATGPLDVPDGLTLCWANDQDYGPYALTATARSTRVTGSTPPNTALGGTGTQALTPSLFTNTNTFYAPTVSLDGSTQALTPSLFTNTNVFYAPTVALAAVKGVSLTLSNGATLQASLTGIRALWWDAIDPSGAPTYSTATASTNASGVLVLDLNASTADAIGDYGFLLLYKVNATINNSLAFAGQVALSNVA